MTNEDIDRLLDGDGSFLEVLRKVLSESRPGETVTASMHFHPDSCKDLDWTIRREADEGR